MTRVAVTGIGMVTPLASNVNDTWNKLIESQSGIRKITSFETSDLSVKIAGQIPKGEKKVCFNPDLFVEKKDQRKIDDFILYAIAAAEDGRFVNLDMDEMALRRFLNERLFISSGD